MRKFGKKVRNQGGCNTELKTTRTVWRQQAYGKATHSYNASAQLCALGIETAGFVVVRGRVVSRVNESIHNAGPCARIKHVLDMVEWARGCGLGEELRNV